MVEGILIAAMMVFALRGYFLGFVPLLSRLVGYGATYYFSYRYADELAAAIGANTAITLGPIALRIGSAIVVFFACMLISALVLSLFFRLLTTLIPPLKTLFERRSLGSKLLGASANTAVAAIFVLTGAWAYQLVSPNTAIANTRLSPAVNWVGVNVNAQLSRLSGTDLPQLLQDSPLAQRSSGPRRAAPTPVSVKSTATGPGSALIFSSADPSKRLSLGGATADTMGDDFSVSKLSTKERQNPPTTATVPLQSAVSTQGLLETLLNNEAFRELINNPKVQQLIGAQFEQSANENTQTTPEP